ncbi:DUF6157 family protein [Roseisalinus antarcticus]|uniref:Uncharacterized protein n=1 Tax=Roseisalinus antarcticus TaxID=254357 RepID=A0A1Y5RBR3_9RHOB|nr:DUF6157 family protein [Roseisalinus antarcticus]SLN13763.1 hypothetical protein ROA7023_00079 [Roseisalinus antarcticus]
MHHSTNYSDTFLRVSPDTRATSGTPPPKPGTVTALEFCLLHGAPYGMTSDDLLVAVTAERLDRAPDDRLRAEIFASAQPCLRSSPLVRIYGWGIHYDQNARIALVGCETEAYARLAADPTLNQIAGLRRRA